MSDIAKYHNKFADKIDLGTGSPFSLFECLLNLYSISAGKTEKLLKDVLELPLKSQLVLDNNLIQAKCFKNTNIICINKSFKIKPDYSSNRMKIIYASPSDAAVINSCICKATNGIFKDIIQPESLERIQLLLINCIYFKSKWQINNLFHAKNTKMLPFSFGLNNMQNIPAMIGGVDNAFTYGYYEDTFNQVVEMPYEDSDFSMVIILPKNTYAVPKFKNYTLFRQCLFNYVQIPKFKVMRVIILEDVLKCYGLEDLYSHIELDICEPLIIDDVVQNVFIEVNEEGTEMACVTLLNCRFSIQTQNFHKRFVANHPFVYYIRHKPTNCVLYQGTFDEEHISKDPMDHPIKINEKNILDINYNDSDIESKNGLEIKNYGNNNDDSDSDSDSDCGCDGSCNPLSDHCW